MKHIRRASHRGTHTDRVEFTLDDRHVLRVQFLDQNILRLLLFKDASLRLNRTWSICPGAPELPYGGRPRESNAGFPGSPFELTENETGWRITGESVTLYIDRDPFNLTFVNTIDANTINSAPLLTGCDTGFLSLGRRDDRLWNLWRRNRDDRFYGLGEKSGELDHSGRRFEMRCLDAMGYDAQSSDPLYKHYPFLLLKRATGSIGMFYDNLAPVVFDTGQELDQYHDKHFAYRSPAGDLDLYLIFADRIKDVTETFSWMTGRTCMGPRWSLGYSGSTMAYTEAPNADELLGKFIEDCATHDIPCHSFQLSSGYTSIENKRYIFHWNREKIAAPEDLLKQFHARDIKLAANIKPVLLTDHPRYDEARAAGLFVRDSEGEDQPGLSRFWDAEGSHLDFTNPAARRWWRENIAKHLYAYGVDSLWNDNNEYEIWDDQAACQGPPNTGSLPIELLRPVQTLLMMQTSFRAHRRFYPGRRAWAISRSGCPGMQRYVQTWSGDNNTDWKTLKYNIRMGLSLSLSGMYNIGHDVGGFAGPRPAPELLVRWIQNGIFHPRFTIHSWNDDARPTDPGGFSVTEPWMYPEVLGVVRAALHLRLSLAPYLYGLLHRAHVKSEPIIRPTFYDHEADPACFQPTDDFMLGPSLLVASVVEEDAAVREVYLPRTRAGWCDFFSGRWFAGGQTIRVPVTLESIPLFVKAGHLIPLTTPDFKAFTNGGSSRTLLLFPGNESTTHASYLYEDDGDSLDYAAGGSTRFEYKLESNESQLHLQIEKTGEYKPPFQAIDVQVRAERDRPLTINDVATNRWEFS